MLHCFDITFDGIAKALRERPTLRSLSFSKTNGPVKVRYESAYTTSHFISSLSLKCLASLDLLSSNISDELLSSIATERLPLTRLVLQYCIGIVQVLGICCNIRHLNLSKCSMVKLEMNFEVPKLEVLNLSYTNVDDEALYMISKSCCGLLKLSLENCNDFTKKGVNHVVENCTQLRKISLDGCHKVHANIVSSMVSSRPSLRQITAPPTRTGAFSARKVKYFLRQGCLVC
ncbi:putative leucine-rich repeat domain, L domain-containing protein [Medicago truncatula]|nr:putative leucine-rich repeat domain, L domain-containing protein [Medicago truncatula]